MEYEANLERALRGIVTVERGCAITRLPHRPPDDEEPHIYYKRGHGNVTHARLRMAEIVEVLLAWEPGKRRGGVRGRPPGAHAASADAGDPQRVRVTLPRPIGASGLIPRAARRRLHQQLAGHDELERRQRLRQRRWQRPARPSRSAPPPGRR